MPTSKNIIKHQFKKGQSGNKKGRPKGVRSISAVLKEYLEKEVDFKHPLTHTKVKGSAIELMAMAMIKNAILGDVKAFKEIADRLEGKAAQQIQISNEEHDIPTIRIIGGLPD